VLEMKLRKGVVCHDGNPFNADDVLATFSAERLWGPKPYYIKGTEYFNMIGNVEKIDDYTVRFTLKRNDIAFEHRLSSSVSYVICDEAWNAYKKDGVGYMQWMDNAAKKTRWNPVGTGPYKFVDYVNNDHVTLASNDAYWEGKPAAERITFRSVPEVAARVAGLVAGDYDMAVQIPPDQWDSFRSYPDVTLKTTPLDSVHIVVFNERDPVLSDKKLRQALSYAIDRQALIDALWKGRTVVPVGHQHPDYGEMYVTDREGKGYPYDPEKAKQLLAESKYRGQEISYRIVPNYYLYNIESAQILQEMWRAIGVNMRIDYMESFASIRKTPGLQIYLWQNSYRIPDPTGQMMLQYGPDTESQVVDRTFVAPPEFNELNNKVAGSLDKAQRRKDWGRMLDIFEDDMPASVLFMPMEGYGMKKNVDWTPYSQYIMDFRASNLKIEPD
jgi:peptide/nickel transport system substrate-binding protein